MKQVGVKWIMAAAAGALCCSVALVLAGEGKEKNVTLDSVPDAVRQSIVKESGGNALKDIEETEVDGKTVYEADWIKDGKEIEVKVASDGSVLEKAKEEGNEVEGKDGDKDEDEDEEKEERHERGDRAGDKADSCTDSFELAKYTLKSSGKNDFFILEPGYQLVLENKEGNRAEKLEITVLNETRKIGNTETRIVEERETVNGEPKEISRNFFAFCEESGSVFYFGEETDEYKEGKAVRGNDSWAAGENNAKPGLIMPGLPLIGARYFQEVAPGVAMDRAEIVSLNETLETPAGRFEHCLKTEESSPLEPGEKEFKLYAPSIGLIKDEDLLLTKHGFVNK